MYHIVKLNGSYVAKRVFKSTPKNVKTYATRSAAVINFPLIAG